ncbi:hypothetical protein PMLGA01_110017500 [Plasmodium malariae]|uniref:Uncharacterized protein n=1 Tax=Plasmodium malariae TaxID=5858 RepID=A0A1C3KZ81_PLAMA|nr:hypothetical protein PMLGA01_110017500 [Plasmodium malariae]
MYCGKKNNCSNIEDLRKLSNTDCDDPVNFDKNNNKHLYELFKKYFMCIRKEMKGELKASLSNTFDEKELNIIEQYILNHLSFNNLGSVTSSSDKTERVQQVSSVDIVKASEEIMKNDTLCNKLMNMEAENYFDVKSSFPHIQKGNTMFVNEKQKSRLTNLKKSNMCIIDVCMNHHNRNTKKNIVQNYQNINDTKTKAKMKPYFKTSTNNDASSCNIVLPCSPISTFLNKDKKEAIMKMYEGNRSDRNCSDRNNNYYYRKCTYAEKATNPPYPHRQIRNVRCMSNSTMDNKTYCVKKLLNCNDKGINVVIRKAEKTHKMQFDDNELTEIKMSLNERAKNIFANPALPITQNNRN